MADIEEGMVREEEGMVREAIVDAILLTSHNGLDCGDHPTPIVDVAQILVEDIVRPLMGERNRLRAAVDAVRAICDGVEYKDPGWPDTYGPYPEGRHDLSAEIERALDAALGTEEAAADGR